MSQSVAPFRPQLLRALDGIGLLLDEVAAFDPTYLTAGQKQEFLVALDRQANRLARLTARTLSTASDVAETRHQTCRRLARPRDPPGPRRGSASATTR